MNHMNSLKMDRSNFGIACGINGQSGRLGLCMWVLNGVTEWCAIDGLS